MRRPSTRHERVRAAREAAPVQRETRQQRGNVRAQLRVLVKRILRKYGYPPDKQERATQTVLEQAEQLTGLWAGAAG